MGFKDIVCASDDFRLFPLFPLSRLCLLVSIGLCNIFVLPGWARLSK